MAYSTTWSPSSGLSPPPGPLPIDESHLRSGIFCSDLLDLLLGHPADDLRADRLGARFDTGRLLRK